jgi:hypothetical protein
VFSNSTNVIACTYACEQTFSKVERNKNGADDRRTYLAAVLSTAVPIFVPDTGELVSSCRQHHVLSTGSGHVFNLDRFYVVYYLRGYLKILSSCWNITSLRPGNFGYAPIPRIHGLCKFLHLF